MSGEADAFELREIRGPSAFGGGARRMWDLLWLISVTEFRTKYSNTGLGYVWSVLKPFAFYGIIYLVVSRVLRFGGEVVNYPAMLVLNLVIFQYFQEATGASLNAIPAKEPLVRKMQFPRIVIPLAVSLSALITMAFNLIGVLLLFLVDGIDPMWTWLLFPFVLLVLVLLTTALSMLLSVVNVRWRDVAQGWTLLLRALFYACPILYPLDAEFIPDGIRNLFAANPLAPIMEQARIWVLDPGAPTTVELSGWLYGFAIPVAVILLATVIGYWSFEREAPRVAEAI